MIVENPTQIASDEPVRLDEIAKSLYVIRPFYGIVLAKVHKRFDDSVKTLAVTMRRELLVNREFITGLSFEHRLCAYEHEVLHLALLHLTRFSVQLADISLHKLINIACDCAINQLVSFPVPPDWITLDTMKKILERDDVEPKQTADYYFKLMMDRKKEIDQKLEDMSRCEHCSGTGKDGDGGDCPFCGGDGLSEFGKKLNDIISGHNRSIKDSSDGSGNIDPFLESAMRSLLQKAKEHQAAMDRRPGITPGSAFSVILPEYVTTDRNVWRRAINRCVGEHPVADVIHVYNRPNRRNHLSNWGSRHDLVNNRIYIGIDTSASVSESDLRQFISHISRAIRSYDLVVDIIYCDHKITNISKNVKSIPMHTPVQIKGRGGTDLRNILDHIENVENGRHARLVMLTDGMTPFRKAPTIEITAIYTKDHTPIDGIGYSAVLET